MSIFRRTLKLVTFDVTYTLLGDQSIIGWTYADAAKKIAGTTLDPDDVAKKFKVAYKHMCKEHPNFGRHSENMLWEEWWRTIVRNTLNHYISDRKAVEHIATELIESYKLHHFWELRKGSLDILEYLKDSRVHLGVISNFDPRLREILKNTGIIQYFDFILSSYEAGYAKPDTEIFLKALLIPRTRIMPMQALHIGDNVELDYLAARKCGWQAALVSSDHSKYASHEDVNKEHIFDNLADLMNSFVDHKDLFED